MDVVDLEQSGFRRLKLVDHSSSEGDYYLAGGSGGDYQFPHEKLLRQIATHLQQVTDGLLLPIGSEVSHLLSQPPIVLLIDKFINDYEVASLSTKKNTAKSVEYRTSGNQDYARSKLAQAAYYYTMAIVYAPDVAENDNIVDKKVPEELSLAYGNRSVVLFELGKYDACLADIEHALATGYPRQKYPKLLLRKVECLISLVRLGEAKHVWEQVCRISGAEPKDDERALKIRLQLLDIDLKDSPKVYSQTNDSNQMLPIISYLSRTGRYQPSTKLAPLSAKIESTKTQGLVAKQDIDPGDILVVESPFASILKKTFEFHFCHHCCRRLEMKIGNTEELCIAGSLVPCTHCTRVLYCSTDCRTEAWRTYHQYECSILPVLYEMTKFGHLALRVLLVAGLDVASRVSARNAGKEEQVGIPELSDPTDVAAYYEHVYQLMYPLEETPSLEWTQFVLICPVMVQLMKKCGFVHTVEQSQLVGTILLRHCCQMYSKSHKIMSRISTHDSPTGEKAFFIGLGIYPYLVTAVKHSCDPNATNTLVNGALLLYRATKCIPAGTEVTISYGPHFIGQNLHERQEALWKQYHFLCACSKCVIEGRDGLNGKYFPIGCKDCGSTLIRATPSSSSFNCSSSSCSTVMSLSTVEQLYAQAESHLAIVNRLISLQSPDRNQLAECERHLAELSNMKGMRSYHNLTVFYYDLSVHFLKNDNVVACRQCVERMCEILEVHSGTVEMLYQSLLNLAKVYCVNARATAAGSAKIYWEHLPECYPRVLKRAIELGRLFTLADAEHDSSAPGLLVDESRQLWEDEQNLLKRLNDFQGNQ